MSGFLDRDPNDIHDRVYMTPLVHGLFGAHYTAEQAAYLERYARCPCCGAKPATAIPLPGGWTWDCMAFTVDAWCPACDLTGD